MLIEIKIYLNWQADEISELTKRANISSMQPFLHLGAAGCLTSAYITLYSHYYLKL
jgi:hypothetical protein